MRARRILGENALLALLLAGVGGVLLFALAPVLLVADSWLTLVAGREIAEHGLPRTNDLTVIAAGAEWVDQQWLAQLAFYGLERLGGIGLVVVAAILLVLAALGGGMAAARARGASIRATAIVAVLTLFAAPWSWQVRAQSFALPLFVAALWLLIDGRDGPRRRTFAVFAVLVVWANLHGSVALGALLTVLYGLTRLVATRGGELARALPFLLLPPLCMLASPYALDLPGYYHLMLVDAPFADVIREWQPSRFAGRTVVFYAVAAVAALLVAVRPRRLTLFELLALAVTFAGAVTAIRGIAWFALAALVILPYALDGVVPALTRRPSGSRLDRVVGTASATVLALAVLVTLVRPASWFEREWPEELHRAVAEATADPSVRVYPSDRHADWLLWKLPELRGRLAYDVRFEILTEEELDAIVDDDGEAGANWKSVTDGYRVVVVDERSKPVHTDDFLSEPGARAIARAGEATVIERAAP